MCDGVEGEPWLEGRGEIRIDGGGAGVEECACAVGLGCDAGFLLLVFLCGWRGGELGGGVVCEEGGVVARTALLGEFVERFGGV